jgi:cellulose synthase/poly-beta-1,6-N-acetylglucosamine synthase-like glycosyltransferase
MLAEIVFWTSVLLILHSYLFFPQIIKLFAWRKSANLLVYQHDDLLPSISVLISVYNEEEVIGRKLQSIWDSKYISGDIEILIGSDASTDGTNQILRDLSAKREGLHFFEFRERQGKANIMNQLVQKARGEILVLTDANVILDEVALFGMVKHYKNPAIGLVDTYMINRGQKKNGISIQESAYISMEVKVKNNESKLWGTMMGPFGGCYSLRKSLYSPVPVNFKVDDFYINMMVLDKGFRSINEMDARVYEDVSNDMKEEFRRKVRISTGNFQNLAFFSSVLLKPFSGRAFCFFSHKVLRWLAPFFIVISYVACLCAFQQNNFYKYLFYLQSLFYTLPLFDFFLRKIGIHLLILRFISHFLSMNVALFWGLIKFIEGVDTNVWQPTKRNQ